MKDPGGSSGRPRLACVSPLPPVQSGISEYTVDLIAGLEAHYDIDFVVDQPAVTGVRNVPHGRVRSLEWFRSHAADYDRVVYQLGNSPHHARMLRLLQACPGVVVVHDFFLGDLVLWMARQPDRPFSRFEAIRRNHGWLATVQYARPSSDPLLVRTLPMNRLACEHALGVIVHSQHCIGLARRFLGARAADAWSVVPLVRTVAPIRDAVAAKRRLGLPPDAVVIGSFGLIAPQKRPDLIVAAWERSGLARDPRCLLLFVGGTGNEAFAARLARLGEATGGRVRATGWLPRQDYEAHLDAADVAVQLRSMSRGETSAAALDCMNHGLATIVNANGAMAELPADAVVMLREDCSSGELGRQLARLCADAGERQRIGDAARRHVHTRHSPDACAAGYVAAIEAAYAR